MCTNSIRMIRVVVRFLWQCALGDVEEVVIAAYINIMDFECRRQPFAYK